MKKDLERTFLALWANVKKVEIWEISWVELKNGIGKEIGL